MTRLMFAGLLLVAAQASSPQCGQTPSTSPSSTTIPTSGGNVLPIVVNGGPTNNSLNQPFASVTICVPGTSNCQTIGGILVDTGSEGLRILSSAVSLPLPQQKTSTGAPVGECLAYIDGTINWGSIHLADIRLAGEQANSTSVQIIGTDRVSIPDSCANGGTPQETVDDFGANGVLGVSMNREDCGIGCTVTGTSNPGRYYACPTPGTCQVTALPVSNQISNPVTRFQTDNNGVAIQFPVVPVGGQFSASVALIFGIGTQSNNQLGAAKLLAVDGRSNFVTTFNGQAYNRSFIDSGSDGIFFLDSASTGLPKCTKADSGFYCPPSLRALSATQTGVNGSSSVVAFAAGNLDAINGTFSAIGEATGSLAGQFDWGLPFFYGRTVFVAITGASTPVGAGPFWAW